MNYNFIFIGMNQYYRFAYNSIANLNNVKYYEEYNEDIKNKLTRFFIRLNYSERINKLIKYPFQNLINKYLFNYKFHNNLPVCYVFLGRHESLYQSGYIGYLKRSKPNCKLVLYLQDLLATYRIKNISEIKNKFDLVLSFDKKECDTYGFIYYESPFSFPNTKNFPDDIIYDIYFCGRIKNRYDKIIKTYLKCKALGLRVKFILTEYDKECYPQADDLIYSNDISYKENLKNVNSSKCVLEILQDKASDSTPRLLEAIFLNKHFLTDNPNILNSRYIQLKGIHYLQDLESINSWINSPVTYKEDIKRSKLPIELLKFLDFKFS